MICGCVCVCVCFVCFQGTSKQHTERERSESNLHLWVEISRPREWEGERNAAGIYVCISTRARCDIHYQIFEYQMKDSLYSLTHTHARARKLCFHSQQQNKPHLYIYAYLCKPQKHPYIDILYTRLIDPHPLRSACVCVCWRKIAQSKFLWP